VETWLARFTTLSAWRTEPDLWVLSSFILYLFGAQIAVRTAMFPPQHDSSHGARALVWWAIRLAYLIGIPYAALLVGALSPKRMGLSGLDWVRTLGMGMPLAMAAWLAILIGWRRGTGARNRVPPSGSHHRLPAGWPSAIVEAAAQQWHWAFYRSAAIRWWGLYWGTWAGVLLLLIEWCGHPFTWQALRHPGRIGPILLRLLVAVVTASLYLVVPNWWLGWGFHALVLLGTGVHTSPAPGPQMLGAEGVKGG